MATYTFKPVPAWGPVGTFARVGLGRSKAFPATLPAGGNATVVQGGVTKVGYVETDGNGLVPQFTTTDIPSVMVDFGFGPQIIHSLEAITAGAASAAAAAASASAASSSASAAAASAASAANKVAKSEVIVNARDFGAALNGTTDDTTPFANAITQAATAGTFGAVGVVTWSGRAKVSALTLVDGVQLRGLGGATLVQTGSATKLISAAGSLGSALSLTVNAAAGATTLTMSSTASLAAGDSLLLGDNVSFSATDSSYKSGEIVGVKSVDSGTQVTLYGPVRGSFGTTDGAYTTANSATVKKVTVVRGVGLADFAIEGDTASTTTLAQFDFCDAPTVRNVTIRKGGHIGLRFHACRDFQVVGGSIRDLTDNIGGGQVGYAVAASGACEGGTMTGVTVSRVRHAFTTMGGADGIPRSIAVTGNSVSHASTAALDTHAAGDDITIVGNVIYGGGNGISIRSRNTLVAGNQLRNTGSHGITLAEENCKDVALRDNTLRNVASGAHGITTTAVDGLEIRGNTVDRCGADGIRVDVGSKRVEISDNTVKNVGTSLANRTCIVSVAGGTPQAGWVIQRNLLGSDSGVGSVGSAVSTGGSLTGAFVIDNRAVGTFTSTVWNTTTNSARRNDRVDTAPTSVTGSRGGNAALASLLTTLAAQGLITDGSSA